MPLISQDQDAAKRIVEAVTLHLLADTDNAGRWIAFSLADGTPDPTSYPSKADAVRCQLDPRFYGYLQINWTGITQREALSLLTFYRHLLDRGVDPSLPRDVHPHLKRW